MGQLKPIPHDNSSYYTDMQVGEILRHTRESYNQSLQDVERNLRIRASQIHAIEQNDFAQLPGRVYAIGFVRSYAEYLGLDGDQVIKLLKSQFNVRNIAQTHHFPVAASEGNIPRFWILLISIFATIIFLVAGFNVFRQDRTLVEDIPAVSEQIRERLPEASEEALPETTGDISSASQGIILNITSNSWVEIRDAQENVLVSRVLQAGERYSIPEDRAGLTMSMGNASGVELEIDGNNLGALGEQGSVLEGLSLDKEFLLGAYAQKP